MKTPEAPTTAGSAPFERDVGPVAPKRAAVDALMKRGHIGVGGRHALDDAHSIMADCYGTLGALMLTVERLRGRLLEMEAAHESGAATVQTMQRALQEADLLMDHCDEPTAWREKWAHLYGHNVGAKAGPKAATDAGK